MNAIESNAQVKKNILDLTFDALMALMDEWEQPAYRARQLREALYVQRCDTFAAMTTLPETLRRQLAADYSLQNLTPVEKISSPKDKTEKFLWQLADGYKIESVVIPEGERTTFCISSQVGCPLDCKFCATGKMGLLRNLSAGEIIEQVLRMEKYIGKRPTNIVYMGMGEPMLNYDAVIHSAKTLSDPGGYALSPRRITISTSGIIPGIYRFADEGQPFSLAVSLNSVKDDVRREIMPVSKKYPIDKLLEAARYYTEKSGRLITFEYVLLDRYNSMVEDARRLVKLTHRLRSKINVIPCNSTEKDYLPPSKKKIERFREHINERSRRITVRKRKGWEIQAACGQLYAANERRKKNKKN